MQDMNALFDSVEIVQMVVFKLGKEEYCVPIMTVQEIIMPQEMTKIPRSPKFIEGVINLRGNIVPIIDGCKRFNIEEKDCTGKADDERIVVLDINNHIVGLVVNDVSEVINLSKGQIDANPTCNADAIEFILGIAKLDKRLLIVLNPEKFLEMDELESLSNISQMIKQMSNETKSEKLSAKKII